MEGKMHAFYLYKNADRYYKYLNPRGPYYITFEQCQYICCEDPICTGFDYSTTSSNGKNCWFTTNILYDFNVAPSSFDPPNSITAYIKKPIGLKPDAGK